MSLQSLLEDKNEIYYWIGYLMADGYLDHDRGKMSLFVSGKDKNHIEKFCRLVDSKLLIKGSGFQTSKGDVFLLPLISKKYCFNYRKTFNPPDNLDIKSDDLFLSFIIGYIDGDGCISTVKSIGVECNINWMGCLNKWFKRVWFMSGCKEDHGTHKIPVARIRKTIRGYSKNETCIIQTCNRQFVEFLKNKTIELNVPCLKRKWDRI